MITDIGQKRFLKSRSRLEEGEAHITYRIEYIPVSNLDILKVKVSLILLDLKSLVTKHKGQYKGVWGSCMGTLCMCMY